jgi:hypothetical protein
MRSPSGNSLKKMHEKARIINGNAADLINDSLVTEVLHFKVRGSDIDKWNKIDDEIWTSYLASQDGFVRKTTNVDRNCEFSSANCDVYNYIDWQSFAQWKAINAQDSADVDMVRKSYFLSDYNYFFRSFWLNARIKTSSNKCKIQCHLEQRD